VARDFTIFIVHLLAIQRVISAIGSLVTGTRAKSKRRLHGTTTCLTLSRSYFNERCIRHYQTQFRHSRLYGANTAPTTAATEVLADSKPAASYTLAYLTAWLYWMMSVYEFGRRWCRYYVLRWIHSVKWLCTPRQPVAWSTFNSQENIEKYGRAQCNLRF
jgi:hypothetical protein